MNGNLSDDTGMRRATDTEPREHAQVHEQRDLEEVSTADEFLCLLTSAMF